MKPDRSIVILGGLGFMGSHVSRKLVQSGLRVRIFDRPSSARDLISDIVDQVEVIEGDITQPETVVSCLGDSEVVINLIHTTVPGSSMADPEHDIVSNVAGTVGWLRQLDKTMVRRIIYVSSGGTVYGLPESIPISEEHPTNPICSYGITKLAIEKYTAMYANLFGMNYLILRPSNVYGPGQQLHAGQGVIGVLGNRVLNRQPLEIWGTGTNQRDYLFIDDLTRALTTLISYNGAHQIFNVSSGTGHSVLEIVSILRSQFAPLPEVIHYPERGFDAPVNILDSSRIHAETGWRPTVPLEEGVMSTFAWLQNKTREF